MTDSLILKRYVVGPLAVNAYIIGCPETKRAIVIDPAGSEEMLTRELKELGLSLDLIVNTHGHPDHTCGNEKMRSLTGAPVAMHGEDDALFRSGGVADMFTAWGFRPAPPADRILSDGDTVNAGNLAFEVIHTPGHSPGSICLFGQGLLVTGDTLFVGAIGRTDLPGGSLETLMHSIKTRLLALPDSTVVLPGHDYGDSPTSTLERERKTNPYILEYC